jgi:hypothetical protein
LPSSTGTNTKFFQAILQPCSAGEVLWRRQLLLAGLWDSGSSHGCSNCRHNSRFSQKCYGIFRSYRENPFFHLHRKKRFTSFPSPAGMSLTKLPLGRNDSVMTSLFPPKESLVVTSRLGTGNSRTFFYGVASNRTIQLF